MKGIPRPRWPSSKHREGLAWNTMSDLVERIRDVLPSVRRDLEDLVRIESVWADPGRRDEVHRSAQAVADLLSQAGFGDVRIVSEGGAQAVIARHTGTA